MSFWDVIRANGSLFYTVIYNNGEALMDRIEEFIATEADPAGGSAILIPSDTAMRELLRRMGRISIEEFSNFRSSEDFILAHLGTAIPNIGRGNFGGFLGGFVGGTFRSLEQDKTSIGFKFKTEKQKSCDEQFSLIDWVDNRKNMAVHLGSANRFDTIFAGEEYDNLEVADGRLDCADIYKIPIVIISRRLKEKLQAESRGRR